MEMEVQNNPKKLRMAAILKRCGAIQIILGLALVVVSGAALGLDRGYMPKIENSTVNGNSTFLTYDFSKYIIGLDVVSIVCSVLILVTGFLPSCMARMEANLIAAKVTFMVASILCASMFAPFIPGAAIGAYFMRDQKDLWITVVSSLLSLIELGVATAASVYCCATPWYERQFRIKSMENGEYKKMSETSEPGVCKKCEKKKRKEEKKKGEEKEKNEQQVPEKKERLFLEIDEKNGEQKSVKLVPESAPPYDP